MAKLYLGWFSVLKNGIGVEFEAKMRILKMGSNPLGEGQSAKKKKSIFD